MEQKKCISCQQSFPPYECGMELNKCMDCFGQLRFDNCDICNGIITGMDLLMLHKHVNGQVRQCMTCFMGQTYDLKCSCGKVTDNAQALLCKLAGFNRVLCPHCLSVTEASKCTTCDQPIIAMEIIYQSIQGQEIGKCPNCSQPGMESDHDNL